MLTNKTIDQGSSKASLKHNKFYLKIYDDPENISKINFFVVQSLEIPDRRLSIFSLKQWEYYILTDTEIVWR